VRWYRLTSTVVSAIVHVTPSTKPIASNMLAVLGSD
jgi:hypothetical protein